MDERDISIARMAASTAVAARGAGDALRGRAAERNGLAATLASRQLESRNHDCEGRGGGGEAKSVRVMGHRHAISRVPWPVCRPSPPRRF